MPIPITNTPVPIDNPKNAKDGVMGQESSASLVTVDKGSDHVFEFTVGTGAIRYQVLTTLDIVNLIRRLAVYKSIDGGVSWTEKDISNEVVMAISTIGTTSFDVVLDSNGTTIWCCYPEDNVNRNLDIISFDTLTDTWGVSSVSGPAQPSSTFLYCSDFRIVQVANGDLWVFFNRSAVFGQTSLQYIVYSGGVWSAEVLIRPISGAVRRILRQVFVDGLTNLVHVTWVDYAINGPAFCPLLHRTVDASLGTLGTITIVDTKVGGGSTLNTNGALFTLGRSCLWQSKDLIILTYAKYGGTPNEKTTVYIGTPISAPVWSTVVIDTTSGSTVQDKEPFAYVDTNIDRLYISWYELSNLVDAMFFSYTDDGITWSIPTLLYNNFVNHPTLTQLHTISFKLLINGDFQVATGVDTISTCEGAALVNDIPPPPLVIVCNNPPPGQVGVPYTSHGHRFPVTGGTEPYSFAITSGALPSGLSIDINTGIVTGTPTEGGNFDFTVTVTDANATQSSVECSILITVIPSPCVNKVRLQLFDDGAGMYVANYPVSTLLESGDNGVPFLLPSPIVFNKPGLVTMIMSNVNDGVELPVNGYLCFTFAIKKHRS